MCDGTASGAHSTPLHLCVVVQNAAEDGAEAEEGAAAAAVAGADSEDGMDDEKKGEDAEADEPLDDKEAQLLKELKMDGYDNEADGAELFLGGHKLLVHDSNAADPYITVPDHEDFDEDDAEDLTVKADDVMIAVAKTEEEASSIEVYIYEEKGGNLYVHHDFPLPSFPLSMCWMDCDPRGASAAAAGAAAAASASAAPSAAGDARGSFLAVGTFQTGIEIWNLDVLDVLEPVATLGGRHDPDPRAIAALEAEERAASKGKKKGKKGAVSAGMAAKLLGDLKEGSHADAVMSLAWHPSFRTRLASGSADNTVKLWDVTTQQCMSTLDSLHASKIQSLNWNYAEPTVLLSGGYDASVCVADVRTNAGRNGSQDGLLRFKTGADIECARWSPHHPWLLAASLENGHVLFFDARSGTGAAPLYTVSAHTKACTSLSFNAGLSTCFLTAGLDKTVKVWDLNPAPTLISTKDVRAAGEVFCGSFDVNYPHLLALGGNKAKLALWDLREDAACRARYGEEVDGRMGAGAGAGQPNAWVMAGGGGGAGAGAAAASTSAASSSDAPSADEKKKKKKKKSKMKTSTRRVREEADSDADE